MTSKNIVIKADKRDALAQKAAHLRKTGHIPAIVYGHGIDNQAVALVYGDFSKAYKEAGSNTVVSLEVGSDKYDVLIHQVDLDPVRDRVAHVDFIKINKDEKIKATIPVELVGECSLVKDFGGSLLHELDEVEVWCLPKDLLEKIEVDVSAISAFNEPVRVKDMRVPAAVELLTDAETVVVNVVPPRTEEESTGPADVLPEAERLKQEAEKNAAAAKNEDDKNDKK